MCGRYLIISPPEAIRRLFGYAELPNFPPRYNVAPTQPIPIVRIAEGVRQFALVRWGLIPPWVKDPKAFSLLIHARGESVNDKPAFRNAMKRRRCLIPADGFYEWKEEAAGRNRPFAILPRHGGPFALAGLWETWMGPNGEELDTAALITTVTNQTLSPIHHRMPVVVLPEDYERWLDCAEVDAKAAVTLIRPAPEDFFQAHEISTAVNRVANDTPAVLDRVPAAAPAAEPDAEAPVAAAAPAKRARKPKEDDRQSSLF